MSEETERQANPEAGGQDGPASRKSVSMLSLTAIALSVFALLVSVLEVSAIRDEQRVQVWPFIELELSYSAEGFELRASNKGIGPARIRGITMLFEVPVDSPLTTGLPDMAF